ncbi:MULTISPECIES: GxxExxY protein [Psychrilyobacter]|uniref:GxxExxY protein n=1 Tax=Psychrilyobacter piezotolerans TaxID=2293438 RepID=A0ABX9KDR7_9FUSO|nr:MULTISPECIES: GxxExxY protein [Psychrilyobacter]MCS5422127.1 GxxExxY protein [Psychrilyobacter sp. S5]NDI76276.1 GxxExxY protein [Psychrilyobacter piezotolerans]RDE59161.1 GxxExxY protein [Psychrilyobacter sp. S5]REI39723.1 GxxExxY protein [Psychrilyobacter piezotolerans]
MFYEKDLTYKIIGIAMEVYNELGYGFLEKVYEKSLLIAFKENNLEVKNQFPIDVYYHNKKVGEYIADLIIEEKVIVELKSIEKLNKVHNAQLLNYLKATNKKIGLLINFSSKGLEYKRIIN